MIINSVLDVILAVALAIITFLGLYTMIRCESQKRNSFMAMLASIFLFVLGYLIMITAHTADGGFAGKKIDYMGAAFLVPISFWFVSDYCELKLNLKAKASLFIVPALIVVLMWTTEVHGLIYKSFDFITTTSGIRRLEIEKGDLYYLTHIYAALVIVASLSVLLHRLIKWDKRHRATLFLIALGVITPAAANSLHVLKISALEGINYTPVSMTVVAVVFFINIVRNEMFDVIPRAKEVALQSLKEALVLVGCGNKFLYANETARSIFPGLGALSEGEHMQLVESWPKELFFCENEKNKEAFGVEFNISHEHYDAAVSSLITKKDKLMGYIIIIRNVTESVVFTKKLKEMAHMDALTGVYNRRSFMELAAVQFESCRRSDKPCSLLMIDLDYFKKCNDTYGHLAGDEVLRTTAAQIKGCTRGNDIFARYGGEEFVMLIAEAEAEVVKMLAERIRKKIQETVITYEDFNINVTCSIGIAMRSGDESMTDTMARSDAALYQAKNNGRNQVFLQV
ncbi:MAG: diguanylate cyclase [Oscillospiraceae bacterium]|nr:diguanylate cyclase [Oscillospiraceae bacterium]